MQSWQRQQLTLLEFYSTVAQRDAANSIRLANDSRAIAIAASRDSAIMRIITAATLVFLPATFVAVCINQVIFLSIHVSNAIGADVL